MLILVPIALKATQRQSTNKETLASVGGDAKRYGISERIPWTTSRIKGTPEPPLPYRSQRVFPALRFKQPLLITHLPGTKRLIVAEQAGKVYSFPNDPQCKKTDLFIDLTRELQTINEEPDVAGVGAVYGLTFHPHYEENRYCYICYVLNSNKRGHNLSNGTRVSRFKVTDTDPPRCDPASEKIVITWLAGGHNGGCLKFGPDGYLYISTGDATPPSPPDELDTGQNLSDLLSCILRIDVDKPENGKAYTVPPDNPFVNLPGARPEIWAYGFRNPWRMSFDPVTGDLWVGDVGWELWELVHRIKKGGNYGWSVMEGNQPVRPEAKRGPTPILPPAIEFPHTEAASVTGGYVYRGKKYPDLYGKYICGDWETRKVWAATFDKEKVVSCKLIAQTSQRIVAFGEDHQRELYFLDHETDGGIFQLVPNVDDADLSKVFPRRLSQTGLFSDTAKQVPAPGVIPFSINAEQWNDYATAERYVALPKSATVTVYEQPQQIPRSMFRANYFFPAGSVLAKTISLEMERGHTGSRRRIETQVLHFDGKEWHAYSYQWNDEQTDAVLVDAAGASRTFKVRDAGAPGGWRRQKWSFLGRSQCLQCHNPWAGHNLAFNLAQLDKNHRYGDFIADQLDTLEHIGMFKHAGKSDLTTAPWKRYWQPLVDPFDNTVDIHRRARAYLHVNCAHCHRFGGGGTAKIDLRYEISLEKTKTVGVAPVQGNFGLSDASILTSGDPLRSVLYYRMASTGTGRMPHIGSSFVDRKGLQLIHDWIRLLPRHQEIDPLITELLQLDDEEFLAVQEARKDADVQRLAAKLAKQAGRAKPEPEDLQRALSQWNRQNEEKVNKRRQQRREILRSLLSKTHSALLLLRVWDEGRLPASIQAEVLQQAAQETPNVRDLFERFVPDQKKIRRLGDTIDPTIILNLNGSADQGKLLVLNSGSSQCLNCHRIGAHGKEVGPDLTKIGAKLQREELLESLLQPSKKIDPKFISQTVITGDGKFYTGLLTKKTEGQIVLHTAESKLISLAPKEVEQIIPQPTSLMPAGLLRELTAQQAADILAYLQSLK